MIAREKFPNNVEILTAIGLVKRRQNDWKGSVDFIERVIELNPRHSNSYIDLGLNFAHMRQYGKAEKCFDRAITLSPRIAASYIAKITTYLAHDGHTARVENVLRTASEVIPPAELTDAVPFVIIRVMPEIYAEIFETTPRGEWGVVGDSVTFHLGLAEVYQQLGRDEQALVHYDSARVVIESNPIPVEGPSAFLRSHHSLAYVGLGLNDEATRIASNALRALPVSDDAVVGPQVAWVAAVVFVRAGEYDQSLDLLEQLLNIPSQLSPGMLRVDPVWDPLRDHPRFQRLLEGDE
jgi:serine/threonine-protein kinase